MSDFIILQILYTIFIEIKFQKVMALFPCQYNSHGFFFFVFFLEKQNPKFLNRTAKKTFFLRQ